MTSNHHALYDPVSYTHLLGAVMDVALSLASSLHELREADGKMSGLQLFAAGMRIGRDMIGRCV